MENVSRPHGGIFWSLLLIHAVLLAVSARLNFVTIDEIGYIPSGLSHWQTDGFSWYCVNPPLPRMVATLPLLLASPQTHYDAKPEAPGERREWIAGPQFAADNATNYFDLVYLSRWAGIAWSMLGGWLVCRWAGELYGARAGYLSLVLWCFGPNILAHAQLITPDIPATVAGFAATYAFWHYLRRPSWTRAWFAGLLLGLAESTKFTLLVLYAVWPVLSLLYAWNPDARGRSPPSWRTRLGHAFLVFGLSISVINLGYAFTNTGWRLGEFAFVSRLFAGASLDDGHGNRFDGGWLGHVPVPLPADYVRGIDVQRRDFESGWLCYLAGEWRSPGWWYFYLYALCVKTPLGTLFLVATALMLTLRRHRVCAAWRDELSVWLPVAAILILVGSQTGLQCLRYALPVAPFAFVGAGQLARFWQRGRWKIGVGAFVLLGGAALSSMSVYPHSLAYFNEAVGGPAQGHAHLVDSNLDWGQDLLRLKDWIDRHPEARPLHVACFTHLDPHLAGIDFQLPPLSPSRKSEATLEPGYYAVSINYVQGMAFPVPNAQGRFRRIPVDALGYFRRYRPFAQVGYTLFIYHITKTP